jgi:hypothetical protein
MMVEEGWVRLSTSLDERGKRRQTLDGMPRRFGFAGFELHQENESLHQSFFCWLARRMNCALCNFRSFRSVWHGLRHFGVRWPSVCPG